MDWFQIAEWLWRVSSFQANMWFATKKVFVYVSQFLTRVSVVFSDAKRPRLLSQEGATERPEPSSSPEDLHVTGDVTDDLLGSTDGGDDAGSLSASDDKRHETISMKDALTSGDSRHTDEVVSCSSTGSIDSADAQANRSPVELLARVFPQMKRSVLQLILQGCNNDVVQSIEQVLNNHGQTPSGMVTSPSLAFQMGGRPMLPIASVMNGGIGMKSAFSPISTVATTPVGALRYPYPAGPRGLPFPLPYPTSFFPGLTGMGYGYNAAMAAAVASAGSTKVSNAGYGLCCPYGTSPSDKWHNVTSNVMQWHR